MADGCVQIFLQVKYNKEYGVDQLDMKCPECGYELLAHKDIYDQIKNGFNYKVGK